MFWLGSSLWWAMLWPSSYVCTDTLYNLFHCGKMGIYPSVKLTYWTLCAFPRLQQHCAQCWTCTANIVRNPEVSVDHSQCVIEAYNYHNNMRTVTLKLLASSFALGPLHRALYQACVSCKAIEVESALFGKGIDLSIAQNNNTSGSYVG